VPISNHTPKLQLIASLCSAQSRPNHSAFKPIHELHNQTKPPPQTKANQYLTAVKPHAKFPIFIPHPTRAYTLHKLTASASIQHHTHQFLLNLAIHRNQNPKHFTTSINPKPSHELPAPLPSKPPALQTSPLPIPPQSHHNSHNHQLNPPP
jgi:hypothetical protein